ncbi:hypothetical protein PENTCL1PPCAC_18843, partial [Pristionchus entomophagus]
LSSEEMMFIDGPDTRTHANLCSIMLIGYDTSPGSILLWRELACEGSMRMFGLCRTSGRHSILSPPAGPGLREARVPSCTPRRSDQVAAWAWPGGTPSARGRCPCHPRRSAHTRGAFEWR